MSGLLSEFTKKAMEMGIPIKPTFINNDLVIEITEQEFKDAVTKGLTETQKQAITIEFHEGKLVIKIKLF